MLLDELTDGLVLGQLYFEPQGPFLSRATTSSGGRAGRKDRAAVKAGYSLAGVHRRSLSQSWASIRPLSVTT